MRKFVLRVLCVAMVAAAGLLVANQARLINQSASAQTTIQLQQVAGGLAFPVFVTSARDGSNRLFILERAGRILILSPGSSSPLSAPFLNITGKVLTGSAVGDERGLLGLAFHPQFKTNGRFFVNYTRQPDGASVIAEYKVSAGDQNIADATEKIILTIAQPFTNHNGGMMAFGQDNFLYIGVGDGGSANDPGNRAQNVDELLGKILRIDVDTPNGGVPYSSPASNPFFGATAGRDEIFALGLRNPWRWSFDRMTGQLYAGDVGQNQVEEIDIIQLGGNYGWRVFEGTRCTNLGPAMCTASNYVSPIYDYQQSGGRCSVTGGYVYRGTRGTLPAGSYIFGDYCTGETLLYQNGSVTPLLDSPYNISSFGEDEAGELYLVHLGSGANGVVYRIVNPNAPAASLASVSAASFFSSGPLSSESIVAAFGARLADVTQVSEATPLPTTLGGTQVTVRDSAGTDRAAPLFFVSPTQVNYLVPQGTVNGNATVTITSWSGVVSRGTVQINSVAPGVFSINANGRGLPAAVIERVKANGMRSTEPVAQFDPAQNQFVAVPIDLGAADDQVFLVLFGTGFRFRSALSAVSATIGGTPAQVTFAGAQGDFAGLDQANILIPRSLIGRGDAEVVLTVDGQMANTMLINIK